MRRLACTYGAAMTYVGRVSSSESVRAFPSAQWPHVSMLLVSARLGMLTITQLYIRPRRCRPLSIPFTTVSRLHSVSTVLPSYPPHPSFARF